MATTQEKLNKALKDSGGKWTKEVNDLAKQRDAEKGQVFDTKTQTYRSTGGNKSNDSKSNDNKSSGLAGLGTALRNAPSNIARDIRMGFNPSSRDADYYRRTAETIARTQGREAARAYVSQMEARGDIAAAGVQNADIDSAVGYGQRIGMLNQDGSVNTNYMGNNDGSDQTDGDQTDNDQTDDDQTYVNPVLLDRMRMQQEQDARARNMEMARMMFERQNMMSPGPVPRQMQGIAAFRNPFVRPMQPPPEEMPPGFGGQGVQPLVDNMRAIPMPRYPQPMPYNPASSPAFRYAAQNYNRLGGMQRTMPRPMEMMSQRERQQIGTIADSFQPQPMQNEYQQGMDMVLRGGMGKGGPTTGPQQGGQFNSMQELMDFQQRFPSANLMGEYQRLRALEGGPPEQAVLPQRGVGFRPNFGSTLASRFGMFGGLNGTYNA